MLFVCRVLCAIGCFWWKNILHYANSHGLWCSVQVWSWWIWWQYTKKQHMSGCAGKLLELIIFAYSKTTTFRNMLNNLLSGRMRDHIVIYVHSTAFFFLPFFKKNYMFTQLLIVFQLFWDCLLFKKDFFWSLECHLLWRPVYKNKVFINFSLTPLQNCNWRSLLFLFSPGFSVIMLDFRGGLCCFNVLLNWVMMDRWRCIDIFGNVWLFSRWVQTECRSLGETDNPEVSELLKTAVRCLRERPVLFKYCAEEVT